MKSCSNPPPTSAPPAISDAHHAGTPTNSGEPKRRGRYGSEKGDDFPLEIHLNIAERGVSWRLWKRDSIGAAEYGAKRRWVVERTAKRGWRRLERDCHVRFNITRGNMFSIVVIFIKNNNKIIFNFYSSLIF